MCNALWPLVTGSAKSWSLHLYSSQWTTEKAQPVGRSVSWSTNFLTLEDAFLFLLPTGRGWDLFLPQVWGAHHVHSCAVSPQDSYLAPSSLGFAHLDGH